MQQFKLSLLLGLVVCVGMCGMFYTTTGGMAAPRVAGLDDKDAKHPRRKDYLQKFRKRWDFIDWCFAAQDQQITTEEAKTFVAIILYVQEKRVGEDLETCSSFDKALEGLEFIDIRSQELTDISPVMGLRKVKGLVADNNSFTEIEAVKEMPSLDYIQVYKNLSLDGKRTSVKCPDFGKRKVTCCVNGWVVNGKTTQDCTYPKD